MLTDATLATKCTVLRLLPNTCAGIQCMQYRSCYTCRPSQPQPQALHNLSVLGLAHSRRASLHHCYAGTNFLVRANAILEVGGSPQYTLTEDYALGMEMKKYGWHCRYVQEYLAIGEAPDQIRNCYQQRSRWCKVRCLCCATVSSSCP